MITRGIIYLRDKDVRYWVRNDRDFFLSVDTGMTGCAPADPHGSERGRIAGDQARFMSVQALPITERVWAVMPTRWA